MVAGATGSLGREVVRALASHQTFKIRVAARDAGRLQALKEWGPLDAKIVNFSWPESLVGLCEGVDTVIACVGASLALPGPRGPSGRASFDEIDTRANLNLLFEAQRAKVRRFIYVAAQACPGFEHTRYILAQDAFCKALRASDLSHTVVRATGFFSAHAAVLDGAKAGMSAVLGDGSAKTNPISEADLAELCLSLVESGPEECPAGGPETFSRRQISEMAVRAWRPPGDPRPIRIFQIPAILVAVLAKVLRLMNPRLGDLLEFVSRVAVFDAVAQPRGTRKLEDYFKQRVALSRSSKKPGY